MPQLGECQVDMEVDDNPVDEMNEGEPSAPREEPVLSTPTDLSVLQA